MGHANQGDSPKLRQSELSMWTQLHMRAELHLRFDRGQVGDPLRPDPLRPVALSPR